MAGFGKHFELPLPDKCHEKWNVTVVMVIKNQSLARSCHAPLRKSIRNRNISAGIQRLILRESGNSFETSFNVREQVSTCALLHGSMPAESFS